MYWSIHKMILFLIISSFFESTLSTQDIVVQPRLLNIQRISLSSFRIKWKVENETEFSFVRYKIFAKPENTTQYIEWPAQVMRVDSDGRDAETIDEFESDDLEFCIKRCTEHRECRYVVKNYKRCYLKDAVPSGKCASYDECYSIKKYYNEAEVYNVPLFSTVQFKVQVFDSYSQTWSSLSGASRVLCTNIPKTSPKTTSIGYN